MNGSNAAAAGWHKVSPVRRREFQVPSAVIPQEWNYFIDPAETDSTESLRWSHPQPFRIDPRLVDPRLR
jgi:hypothetical protein